MSPRPLVLLTDGDDRTMLIACETADDAERVAAAATLSSGDVSAWRVAHRAIPDSERLRDLLRDGHDLSDVLEALEQHNVTTVPRETPPDIEVLVIRDPDSSDDVTIFVDGTEFDGATYENVDPGAGYEIDAWREHTGSVEDNPAYSTAFKAAAVKARVAAERSHYIEGERDPHWTFFGHWENSRIVIDLTLPGVHQDTREQDDERWPEGLWCDSGQGETVEEAEANARSNYDEAEED